MEQTPQPQKEIDLVVLEQKIDKLQKSMDKMNRYFFWTGVLTLVFFVLPLVGLLFAVPYIASQYSQMYSAFQ
jgi:hypothetical protein